MRYTRYADKLKNQFMLFMNHNTCSHGKVNEWKGLQGFGYPWIENCKKVGEHVP
jgi:hypothetical protein